MKVLALTHIYPSLDQPTRGPYNHNILKAIARHAEVKVIVPEPWWTRMRTPQRLIRTPSETQTGLETYLPTYWSVPRCTSLHARAMYRSLRAGVASLRQTFAFEAIFAAWAYPDATATALLARDFDCPFIIETMGSDINVLTQIPGIQRQIIQSMESAYRVISVSHALRDRIVALGVSAERNLVQHNGVDGKRFCLRDRREARAQLELPLDAPLVCYVGRLGHEKGVDVLIEAFHHLKRSGREDIVALLVGWGELETNLRARVSALGLERQIRFCGKRQHDEIPLWISASDLLCLPSRREGCPNVVLETLACGRPVVASAVGGVPELIDASNGLLVPSDDPAALAARLLEALQRVWDPQALRQSVEFLSWEAVGDRYHQVLCDAVSEHRKTVPDPSIRRGG